MVWGLVLYFVQFPLPCSILVKNHHQQQQTPKKANKVIFNLRDIYMSK